MGSPKPPPVQAVDPLPPPPERSDTETEALAAQQRRRFSRRAGRASTFLTAGRDLTSGSAAVRALGGAGGT